MAELEKGEEGEDDVITAVYKVNMHCVQCAREVKKPLIRTQGGGLRQILMIECLEISADGHAEGVHRVDIDTENGEIKVKGKIDLQKIQELIEKRSKKKVELVYPLPKVKEKVEEIKKDNKEPIYSATMMTVHMHCEKCEYDLKRKLLKLKGVYTVNTDIKAQTVKVDGTIDPKKIIKFIRMNLHKHAEIITTKKEIEEQKKENLKEVDVKLIESTKEVKEQKEEKVKEVDVKFIESTGSKDWEEKKVEVEVKVQEQYVPYIIHYVYAPQMFSDENPNACTIM